jgi:hypothetical protein
LKVLKEGDHSKDLGINGTIILKWSFGKYCGRNELDPTGSGLGPVADRCQHGNEPSGLKKRGEFLD